MGVHKLPWIWALWAACGNFVFFHLAVGGTRVHMLDFRHRRFPIPTFHQEPITQGRFSQLNDIVHQVYECLVSGKSRYPRQKMTEKFRKIFERELPSTSTMMIQTPSSKSLDNHRNVSLIEMATNTIRK